MRLSALWGLFNAPPQAEDQEPEMRRVQRAPSGHSATGSDVLLAQVSDHRVGASAGHGAGERMTCARCGSPLSAERQRRHARFCTNACAKAVAHDRHLELNPRRPVTLATATVGALHELVVSCDLLGRGYPVFRALSPSCPCDLIILANGRTYRVEVCTGTPRRDGSVHSPKRDHAKYDILACVFGGQVQYLDALPSALQPTGT